MTTETFCIIGSILGMTSFVLNWVFMHQSTQSDNYLLKKNQETDKEIADLRKEIRALKQEIETIKLGKRNIF